MSEDRAVVPASAGAPSLHLGQTNLTGDNLILPRIKIVQAMAEEKSHGLAEVGDFFNTLTSENYGNSLKFVPLQPFMNRILLVRDEKRQKVEAAMKAGGHKAFKLSEKNGLKCRSGDMVQGVGEPGIPCETCPLAAWGPNNEAPLCSEVYNVASLTEFGDLVILQFQKSSAKSGKKLFSMLRFASIGRAPWSKFLLATTHEETITGKGTFAVPVITATGEAPPTELLKQAQLWANELGALGPIDVTQETAEDANVDATAGDEQGGDEPF